MTAFAVLSVLVLSSVSWTGTDAIYKLENDSKPISYRLHLEPDMFKNYFNGSVTINFTVLITSSLLTLNQRDLMINTVKIEGVPIRKWDVDNEKEILIIYCQSDLIEGSTYTITIEYKGKLKELTTGFYKTSYSLGKEIKWIAMTHFEPTGARLAFPCWDEPMYKAFFNISIRHLSNYTTVISNMPVLRKAYHEDDTVTTYFDRSMPMSTYLVAFMVTDYVFKSYGDHRIKIFTTPDALDKTQFAYDFSLKVMKVMDEYTEIPYFEINEKMDEVTMEFALSDAMENWGFVICRENFLLYEEGVSSITDKDNVITSISHVFAHQWFGNLVTPKWWEYIWLSKGFATYFQYFIIEQVKPAWRFMDLFPVKTMQWGAFRFERWNTTRPMNTYVDHPDEIREVFDKIATDKAACVIRMLAHVLTEEIFHSGLKNYLRINSYSVADSDNLIRHLQDAAGRSKTWGGVHLAEIVKTWVTQSGYPMVTVKKTSPGQFRLSQKQFLYYVPVEEPIISNSNPKKWWIPISYTTNYSLDFADTSPTIWMDPTVNSSMIFEPEADWILLNKQQTGYYRINYCDEIWQKLAKYLNSNNMHKIHPVNRAQLIDDALTMARINYTNYENALSIMLYLHREIDYIPWMTTFSNVALLIPDVLPSRHYNIFKQFIGYILHSVTNNVTYVPSPTDNLPTKYIKVKAMELACLMDVKECLDVANKEFNAWLANPMHHFDPDMKYTILCTGLRTASEKVWDEVLDRLSEEIFDNDRPLSMRLPVMGCSNNRTILEKFLMYAARPNGTMRLEPAVKAVLANTYVNGTEIVQYILDNKFETIMEMDLFDLQINEVAESISSYVKSNEDFLWLSRFAESIEVSERTVQKIVTRSMRNINRIAILGPILDEWLVKNQKLFISSGSEKAFMLLLLICPIFNTMLFKIFL